VLDRDGIVDPVGFWSSAEVKRVAPNVARAARAVILLPPSGAAIEGAFSVTNWIVAPRRARLTLENIEMLSVFSCNKDLAEIALHDVAAEFMSTAARAPAAGQDEEDQEEEWSFDGLEEEEAMQVENQVTLSIANGNSAGSGRTAQVGRFVCWRVKNRVFHLECGTVSRHRGNPYLDTGNTGQTLVTAVRLSAHRCAEH
jgi:hypothetical protein